MFKGSLKAVPKHHLGVIQHVQAVSLLTFEALAFKAEANSLQ
jgi:hypothetical protein